jgi:serine/threonine protein phosphatase PrpC
MKRQTLNMPPVVVDAHMIEGGGKGPMSDAPVCFGVRSHIGQRRRKKDSVRVPSAPEPLSAGGSLFAVSDGVGGHSGGGLASRMGCRELEAYYLLTRVVGTSEPMPLVDTRIDHLHPGDRYLLCTDGLSNTAADNDTADLISRGRAAAGIAEQLVVEALQDNARDNITAVVVIL